VLSVVKTSDERLNRMRNESVCFVLRIPICEIGKKVTFFLFDFSLTLMGICMLLFVADERKKKKKKKVFLFFDYFIFNKIFFFSP
jgi:hypothetical protein